jgi:hypothetical protein
MTASPTSIDSNKIKDVLESIGYNLIDCGNHWRTSAIYRNGDNRTAVQIYKNTGVWNDYIENKGSRPLEALIQLTLKDDRTKLKSILDGIKKGEVHTYTENKELIEMEKIYPESSLERLFPNYNFYKNKSISETTQKFFKVGLAGVGQMYRRMVFPIYDENNQIIGFSGRKVDDDNDFAKWKHLGKRKGWVYPAYIPAAKTVDEYINEAKEVILVESIGDCMSLFDQGIKNSLVTFGLGINPKIISYLSGKEIDRIIISNNNDSESEKNHGLISSIKIFMNLSKFFDLNQLVIKLPPKPHNDFGIAHEKEYNLKEWLSQKTDADKQIKAILNFIEKNPSYFNVKDVTKFSKLCNDRN